MRLGSHFVLGLLTALLVLSRLPASAREERIRRWCARLLDILGVRVVMRGHVPDGTARGVLFVANHISWLDIWALKQLYPVDFVAKAEIRGWPLMGWLAERCGTLFVERHRRHDTGRVMSGVEQALRQGRCLCFFPEGTTTDGSELKPFKPSLFQAAINANAPVWPVAIRYPAADGSINRAVAYCGAITLWQSLCAVLRQREIPIELTFAAPLAAAGQERRHLAQQARHSIASLQRLPRHRAPDTRGDPPAAAR